MTNSPRYVEQISFETRTAFDPSEDYILWSKRSRFAPRPGAGIGTRADAPEYLLAQRFSGRDLRGKPAVALPDVDHSDRRRSAEDFSGLLPLDDVQLSEILDSYRRRASAHRRVASAGALYPLDLYLCRFDDSGCGHAQFYDPFEHALVDRPGRVDPSWRSEAIMQPELTLAPVIITIVYVANRNRWKYGPLALKFGLLEAGGLLHELACAAASLGLPNRPVSGIDDVQLEAWLRLDGVDESVQASILVGALP